MVAMHMLRRFSDIEADTKLKTGQANFDAQFRRLPPL